MPPLLVIPALPRTAQAEAGSLPELSALSELLRLSDAAGTARNWRSGVLADLGVRDEISEAAVAALALGRPAGSKVCLVAPVHAVAGMHRVHLHAAGVLSLAPDERHALAADFAAQFGPQLQLHAAGDQWLLEADFADSAEEADPLEWLGAPLERQPAASAGQRQLRRLGAEIEMWLSAHPVNAQRSQRRQLPVNLLWLWGGGVVPVPVTASQGLSLHGEGEDPWLAGCAALTGAALKPLSGWSENPAGQVVVLPLPRDAAQLQQAESRWLQPALEQLGMARMPALRLRIGRRLHHVRTGRLRRMLRRKRPWWRALES